MHVEMMSDYQVMLEKYRAKEGGVAVPLQSFSTPVKKDASIKEKETEQNIPALEDVTPLQKSKLVQEYDASQPAPPVQPALQSITTSHAWPTPNIETTNFPTPPQSQLHRPPGIPADPKSPTDSGDESDDYVDARGISYSDTEKEREAKLRYIKRLKEQPPPPPPFIDDKDTDARWLSYSDTEDD